jgi:hypothetical protein
MKYEDTQDNLDPNGTDKTVQFFTLLKDESSSINELPSFVKCATSGFGDVLCNVIPNQRLDRVVDYLRELSLRVSNIEDFLNKLKEDKACLLLFETGCTDSSRTESHICRHCYAYYVASAVEHKKLNDLEGEKLFRSITELTEIEIIHLISYSQHSALYNPSPFDKKYQDIIMEHSRQLHGKEEDLIFNAFYDEYNKTLEQKGMISGKQVYNDKKKIFEQQRPYITDYGRPVVDAIYDEEFFLKEEK